MTRLFRALVLALVTAPAAFAGPICSAGDKDAEWLRHALSVWHQVKEYDLKVSQAVPSSIVVFDATCVWSFDSEQIIPADLKNGRVHAGTIELPDGGQVPVGVIAFAGAMKNDAPFFVMSLPSVWAADAKHRANPSLDRLVTVVFVHEMTHTLLGKALSPRIGELAAAAGVAEEEINDDIIQERFQSDPSIRGMFEMELNALYEAAASTDPASRSTKLRHAIQLIEQRRQKLRCAGHSALLDLEELFLLMEGTANWAGYRAARRDGLNHDTAVALVGRTSWWSQDEGLALFLVIDAIDPGWQKNVFDGKPPHGPLTLLREALR